MKSKATLATVFTLLSVLLYACAGNIPITGQDTPPPTEIAEEADVVATSAPIEQASSAGVALVTEARHVRLPQHPSKLIMPTCVKVPISDMPATQSTKRETNS